MTTTATTAAVTAAAKSMAKRPPFDKLDALCIRMLTGGAVADGSETATASSAVGSSGVGGAALTVKQQKYFRVSVPQAFLGSELVQWLVDNMHLDDIVEGTHMGTVLCQHGYLFSVIDQSTDVKNDGTLYRLQLPYYWASQNGTSPDNVEYAIYLNKRLMRNEEKHGLEQHEAEIYNKLMELLGHVWDFIRVQAEMQLKIHKEKKKSERVVLDSQERAFWRIHRPPSGHNSHFELEYRKLERKLKKKTFKMYQAQVDRLLLSVKTKPWLKSPKATETTVAWTDQFAEYDPLVAGCQPSNPWISDDPTLWALNADYVEVPTERRVRRWGFSVQELVKDPIGRQVLDTFLESEFSSENIRFWQAIQDLKYTPRSQVSDKVDWIYTEFLAPGAPCQVNVDSRTLNASTKAINDVKIPKRFAFSTSEEHVFTLMSKDSYPRFVRSEMYKNLISASQQQGTKKLGWRSFLPNVKSGGGASGGPGGSGGMGGGGGSKKPSSNPSATSSSTAVVVASGKAHSTSAQQPTKLSRDSSSLGSLSAKAGGGGADDASLPPASALPANHQQQQSS